MTLLIVFLAIIAILSYLYWKVENDQQRSKMAGYISMLAIIGTFILVLSYFESKENTARNVNKDVLSTYVGNDQKGIIDIERIFMDQSPQLRRLYKQIYPGNSAIQALADPPITPDVIEKEQHMMSIMLQTIETILYPVTLKLMNVASKDFQPWLVTFRSWFASPLLREFWASNKHLYAPETRDFIEGQVLSPPR